MALTNLYSNIALLAPDGELLSKVPAKRADWYVRKDLASWDDDSTLRLKFEPKSRTPFPAWYYVEHQNRCVVCGCTNSAQLEKHHIVPYCFRVYMPDAIKGRRCFDLTLLCRDCHDRYEMHATKFKAALIQEAGLQPYDQTAKCKAERAALKSMKSLLANAGRIDETGRQRMLARVEAVLGRQEFGEADLEALNQEVSRQQVLVFQQTVEQLQPYQEFVVRWRRHFVEFAKPQFLDESWLHDIEVVR